MIDTSLELLTFLKGWWSVGIGCAESTVPILNIGISENGGCGPWRSKLFKVGDPIKTNIFWYICLYRFVSVMEWRAADQKLIKAVAPGRPLQNDRYVLRVIHVFGRLVVGRGQLLSCCRGRCFGSFLFAYSQMINLIRSEKRYKTNRF